MDPKQLGGPVFESICVEGLTSHVGKALPFAEIVLVQVQFLRPRADFGHQTGDHQRGWQKGNDRYDIQGIVHPDRENWRSKEVG